MALITTVLGLGLQRLPGGGFKYRLRLSMRLDRCFDIISTEIVDCNMRKADEFNRQRQFKMEVLHW